MREFIFFFLVIQHKSRPGKVENPRCRDHSEIRLNGILRLNDRHFQAKCDCKGEAGSEISAQPMTKNVDVLSGIFVPQPE